MKIMYGAHYIKRAYLATRLSIFKSCTSGRKFPATRQEWRK